MTNQLFTNKSLFLILAICLNLMIVTVDTPAQQWTVTSSPIEIGSRDAPIKLEVFYDMQCPSCSAFHPILKAALATYQGQLHVTFRHFPIGFHDKAFPAGLAVEAANQQGKGYEMIDTLLVNQNEWAWTPKFRTIIEGYAKKMGLDMVKFSTARNGSQAEVRMITDMECGRRLKLGSVPSVFLNGKFLNYSETMELKEIISKILNDKGNRISPL